MHLLLIDDDAELCALLSEFLKREGFTVDCEHEGNRGLERAGQPGIDLVVLDVMLPDRSGFDVFETLHQGGRTAVIFLTARGATADKLRGLRLGADDYVTKPFDLEELLARVHTVLRRARGNPGWIALGAVTVDFQNQVAKRGAEAIHLTHREFELLRYLAARAGQVVYRNELLRAVWGYPDNSAYTRAVDHAIARLRKKIEEEPEQPRFIHTAHGDGYSLTPG